MTLQFFGFFSGFFSFFLDFSSFSNYITMMSVIKAGITDIMKLFHASRLLPVFFT